MNKKIIIGILVLVSAVSLLFGNSVMAETYLRGGEIGNFSNIFVERERKISEATIQPTELEVAELNIYPVNIYLPMVQKSATVLFKDDFSNSASGWPVASEPYGIWAYLSGEYKIKVLETDTLLWATAGHSAVDFDAKVDARQVDANDSSYGIIFELNTTNYQYYAFLVDPEFQYWYLWYSDGSSLSELAWGSSLIINSDTATNNVEVKRQGLVTKFLVNGSEVYTVSLDSTGGHKIGLSAVSWDLVNVDVRFDNYLVTTP